MTVWAAPRGEDRPWGRQPTEIERTLVSAAGSSTDIAENVALVATTSQSTSQQVGEVRDAVDGLGRVASELADGVREFTLVAR